MVTQRWALLLQYDGSEFAGSQWQPNRPTVQDALQTAITQLGGEPANVSLAGRTDAGVHAMGQVASFLTEKSPQVMPAHRWIRGINHFLPDTVAVQAAAAVNLAFDPRRDAYARTYTYQLRLAEQRQPLSRRDAWIVPPNCSSETLRNCLPHLIGRHNFAAFTPPTSLRSTVRTLTDARLEIVESGNAWRIHVTAQSFLHHQVRRMVGALIEVARGRQTGDAFQQLLINPKPGAAGPTAPAAGLTLASVQYNPPLFTPHSSERVVKPPP